MLEFYPENQIFLAKSIRFFMLIAVPTTLAYFPSIAPMLISYLLISPLFRASAEFLWHKNRFHEILAPFILPCIFYLLFYAVKLIPVITGLSILGVIYACCFVVGLSAYFAYHSLKDSRFYIHSKIDRIGLFYSIMIDALFRIQQIVTLNTSIILQNLPNLIHRSILLLTSPLATTFLASLAVIAAYFQIYQLFNIFSPKMKVVAVWFLAKKIISTPNAHFYSSDFKPVKKLLNMDFKKIHYKNHPEYNASTQGHELPTPGLFIIPENQLNFSICKTQELDYHLMRQQ